MIRDLSVSRPSQTLLTNTKLETILFGMGRETNRENWENFYFSDASRAPVVQKLNSIFHQIASSG